MQCQASCHAWRPGNARPRHRGKITPSTQAWSPSPAQDQPLWPTWSSPHSSARAYCEDGRVSSFPRALGTDGSEGRGPRAWREDGLFLGLVLLQLLRRPSPRQGLRCVAAATVISGLRSLLHLLTDWATRQRGELGQLPRALRRSRLLGPPAGNRDFLE